MRRPISILSLLGLFFLWVGDLEALAPSSGIQRYAFEEISEGGFLKQVGERLQELLTIRGWNQIDLVRQVKKMGVPLETYQVSDYILGKRPMRNEVLVRIASALNQGDLSNLTAEERDKLSGHYLLTGEIGAPLPGGILHFGGSFGQRLQEARHASGLTQLEASQRTKMPQTTFDALELGTNVSTSIWNLRRLSEVYEVSVDYLIDSTYPGLRDIIQARNLTEFSPVPKNPISEAIQHAVLDSYLLKKGPIPESESKQRLLVEYLAEETGQRKDYIEHYFNGVREPRISTSIEMANSLDMSLNKFLTDEELKSLSPQIKYYPETLRKRIQYLRLFVKGYSKSRLAKEAGTLRTTLINIELGNKGLEQSSLGIRLARALGVPLDYLFETPKTKELINGLTPGMPPRSVLPFGRTPLVRIRNRLEQLDLTHEELSLIMGLRGGRRVVEQLLDKIDPMGANSSILTRFGKGLDVPCHWILTGQEPELPEELVASFREAMEKGMSVGEWLKERRGEKTLKDLAEGNLSRSTSFSRFEKGVGGLRSLNLLEASSAYRVPVDFLLGKEMAERLILRAMDPEGLNAHRPISQQL